MRVRRRHLDQLSDHRATHALEDDRGLATGLGRVGSDRISHFSGIDDDIDAQLARSRDAGRHQLADSNIARAEKTRPLGNGEADDAGTDDKHTRTRGYISGLPSTQSDSHGLDHCRLGVAQIPGNLRRERRHARRVFGVGTGHLQIETLHHDLAAVFGTARLARGAAAARSGGQRDEPIPHLPPGDAGAEFNHLADVLVPEDVAVLQQSRDFDGMQVGGAYAAGFYLEHQTPCGGAGLLYFGDPQRLANVDKLGCSHLERSRAVCAWMLTCAASLITASVQNRPRRSGRRSSSAAPG